MSWLRRSAAKPRWRPSHLQRRDLIALLAVGAISGLREAHTQQASKVPTIRFISVHAAVLSTVGRCFCSATARVRLDRRPHH